jgi:adenylate cyclase class 2
VDGCTVTLDAVDGLGEFVEAELEVEAGIDDARKRLESVFERLGLDPADQIRTSYLGLLLADEDADPANP